MEMLPKSIERAGEGALRIVWSDAHESVYPLTVLRTECPCAVCQPYGVRKAADSDAGASTPASIRAVEVRPVGRYAIHIAWSDGHGTGIYAYDYLRRLCPCEACRPQHMDEG